MMEHSYSARATIRRKTKRGAVVVVERRFEDGSYLYRRFHASRASLARLARVTALYWKGKVIIEKTQ